MATAKMSPSKPPTLDEAAGERFVILEVGPDKKKYYIHKALLAHHSDYFRTALRGPCKEAQEGVIKLEDIDPAVVDLFVHWLYTSTLPNPYGPVELLVKLRAYKFADRFLIFNFRRAVNNSFVFDIRESGHHIERYEILELAQEAFTNIPLDRPILQLLVDEHCNGWRQCCDPFQVDADLYEQLPPAFLVRAMRRLSEELQREKEGAKEKRDRCYYEHASDEVRKACPGQHMEYDKEMDFGFFGRRVICGLCQIYEETDTEGEGEI